MKFSKKEVLMIAAVVFVCSMIMSLTGCLDESAYQNSEAKSVEYSGQYLGHSTTLYTFENGLECAVYSNNRQGGISCNWDKHNKNGGGL